MEFRWVALIALWTLVSGPILGTPSGPALGDQEVAKQSAAPKAKKAARP
jgi:hypothetical protein